MKAIETNIHRHENGTLYFVARRHGKLHVQSLRTQDLEGARRILREKGMEFFFSSPSPKRSDNPGRKEKLTTRRETRPTETLPTETSKSPEVNQPSPALVVQPAPHLYREAASLEEVLNKHDAELTFTKPGTLKMIQTARAAILRFCPSLEEFSCIDIWKKYQANGLRKNERAVGAATNHLRWYLQKFVPWAVEHNHLPQEQTEKVGKLKKTKVNSRRMQIAKPEKLEELLRMVESEDRDGGAFLRFLACSGARRGSAASLNWSDVDFSSRQATFVQRDGRTEVIPLSDEAISVLASRRGNEKPFAMDINAFERLERRLKRFAKGLGLDLTFFHAFRHNFASQALLSKLNPQEVARLLGHNDGGVLVLKTYGHLCDEHLRNTVRSFRTTPPRPQE